MARESHLPCRTVSIFSCRPVNVPLLHGIGYRYGYYEDFSKQQGNRGRFYLREVKLSIRRLCWKRENTGQRDTYLVG